jgi:transcription antitermination protein NusB
MGLIGPIVFARGSIPVRRRKARELALKMLYQMEVNRDSIDRALERYTRIFPYQEDIVVYARTLLAGIRREQEKLDDYIAKASEHWKVSRITYVDKNILRVAVYEMLYSKDVPPKVAIDEALELAKKFGAEESKDFVNGILDRVLKDFYEKREDGQK